jgi:hypothetical protein
MSVTNKPNDGEPIVELIKDALTGDKYIPTRVFSRFLDELVSEINSEGFQTENDPAALARITLVEEAITDNPFTVDSTGWTVDISKVTVDMAKA